MKKFQTKLYRIRRAIGFKLWELGDRHDLWIGHDIEVLLWFNKVFKTDIL